MKANELRIGNYINCPNNGGKFSPARIDSISVLGNSPSITVQNMPDEEIPEFIFWGLAYMLHELKEIPLTEEWLTKFGFEKETVTSIDTWDEWYLDFIEIDNLHKEFRMQFSGGYVKLQYVYQLQNLYFVLTGNELEIPKP